MQIDEQVSVLCLLPNRMCEAVGKAAVLVARVDAIQIHPVKRAAALHATHSRPVNGGNDANLAPQERVLFEVVNEQMGRVNARNFIAMNAGGDHNARRVRFLAKRINIKGAQNAVFFDRYRSH